MANEVNNEHGLASMPPDTDAATFSRSSTSAWHSAHETAASLKEYEEIKALPGFSTEDLQRAQSHASENVAKAAKDVLEKRFQAQKAFRDSLKEYCTYWADAVAAMDLKLPQFDRQSSNAKYDQWLDSNSSVRLPMSHTSLEVTMCCTAPIFKEPVTSLYGCAIDAILQPETSGALVCRDLSLRQICELASRVPINPRFFAEHLFNPVNLAFIQETGGDIWQIDGLEFFEQNSGMAVAHTRVTCTTLQTNGSFFLVLINAAVRPLQSREELETSSWAITSMLPTDGSFLYCLLLKFFSIDWNCRRVGRIMEGAQRRISAGRTMFYAWLLAVHCYQDEIKFLEQRVREMDFDLIQPLDQEALTRVRTRRAEVSHLRRNLALTREGLTAGFDTSRFYKDALGPDLIHDPEAHELQRDTRRIEPAQRVVQQEASSSVTADYQLLDGQMAALMPFLNETLQIIMASINLADAQESKRNGKRSTLLTLLAAIYLPLTLATGIFGMNIKEIGSDNAPRYWAVLAVAGGLAIPSVCFCIWLFYTSDEKPDKEDEAVDRRNRAKAKERAKDAEASGKKRGLGLQCLGRNRGRGGKGKDPEKAEDD
ncbi:unnamed protein product [Zymoseptoria tritici ST99CH_1E4]|uniref:Uncharacterized protein n=1 Tax=Zymoseptoria tritici ST99CH_1E4 TaxID=1276532 RepID=A0A2H1H523_ZYMTR|nr:unnamed protein product [Zymoseptoria tritici ST99CH_1E4]